MGAGQRHLEGGFLQHLGLTHALLQRWQNDKILQGDPAKVQAEKGRALDYVRRQMGLRTPGTEAVPAVNREPAFAWELLSLMQNQADKAKGQSDFHAELAGCWELFKDITALQYAARYENARSLYRAGQKAEARARFMKLHADTAAKDRLPGIDMEFRECLEMQGAEDPWSGLLTKTARAWIAGKHRPAVLVLAKQCWQLDDQPLARHLLAIALDGVPDKERAPLMLAEVELLQDLGQTAQADALLRKLLANPEQAAQPNLWRLAAALAEKRDMRGRAMECLEKALDLEFRKLPDVIDLYEVRTEYGKLLDHYQSLAEAMVVLKIEPPAGFLTKVVTVADRWRRLDQDGSKVCNAVAPILHRLGQGDLYWDYLTTPIALHPGESDAWVKMAESLSVKGEATLADRAYQAAFEAEPSNAQILWDRAQLLRQTGQFQAARALLRQLADGVWHARFQGLQTQARLQLQ